MLSFLGSFCQNSPGSVFLRRNGAGPNGKFECACFAALKGGPREFLYFGIIFGTRNFSRELSDWPICVISETKDHIG